MSYYRLPNQKSTTDIDEFTKAWDALVLPLATALNVTVISFDPGICVVDKERVAGPSVTLPVWLVERIIKLKETPK
jgi:hypothetical protein